MRQQLATNRTADRSSRIRCVASRPMTAPTAHAMTEAQVRARYRARRYMADMSDADLRQRRKDIARNFMTINADGKLSSLAADHRLRVFWHGRFVDLLEEYVLRFGPYPRGFEALSLAEIGFPDPRSARTRAAMSAVAARRFEDGKYLVKYGKRVHLQNMLLTGTVRITPASGYQRFRDHR